MELELWEACDRDDVERVTEMLRAHPDINVNWQNKDKHNRPALTTVCIHRDMAIASLLLAHPSIDVNTPSEGGYVPFYWACYMRTAPLVSLLLTDPRLVINIRTDHGSTACQSAATDGATEIMTPIIASGKVLEADELPDLVERARESKNLQMIAMLEGYQANRHQAVDEARVLSKSYDKLAASLFSIVVFLCEGLLELGKDPTCERQLRFFRIAQQLPMELQMLLCHRAVGSLDILIPVGKSEAAFRDLATRILS